MNMSGTNEGGCLIPETSSIYHLKNTTVAKAALDLYYLIDNLRDELDSMQNGLWGIAHDEETVDNIALLRGLENFESEPE